MLDNAAKIWMAGCTLVILAFFLITFYGIQKEKKRGADK
jgi:hypothetical protein